MGMASHLYLRATVWTWRRRWPRFSPKGRHLQFSLRTSDRSIDRMLASGLTYESTKMFDAIARGEPTPEQGKA